jgi:hypothetical protein
VSDQDLLERQNSLVLPEPWILSGWGTCRSCGADVAWARNPVSGKRAPFNLEGVNHFADCPQAADWRHRQPR